MEKQFKTKQKKVQLTIQNYTFKRVENFKQPSVILNEDNHHLIDFQESIKNSNKTYLMFMLRAAFLHYFV
jgi:hypothetical protein